MILICNINNMDRAKMLNPFKGPSETSVFAQANGSQLVPCRFGVDVYQKKKSMQKDRSHRGAAIGQIRVDW